MFAILDDGEHLIPADLVRQAARAWPADTSDWVHYRPGDGRPERKETLRDAERMPAAVREVLGMMALLDPVRLLDLGCERLVPDLGLWGAGMHQLSAGGYLGLHWDSDAHWHFGLRRRVNAILYLNEDWDDARGGAFELRKASRARDDGVRLQVFPRFNRLLLFEPDDCALHGVPGPCAAPRLTLAMYYFGAARGAAERPRAEFLGTESA